MKSIFLGLLVLSFLNNSAIANNCPAEAGETMNCENEQTIVDNAIVGLSKAIEYKYCGVFSGERECRVLKRLKDVNGNLADNVYEEWFISFFVQNSLGKFNTYWHDFYTSGAPSINFAADTDDNIEVTFTSNLPSFTTEFFDTLGNSTGEKTLIFNHKEAVLTQYDSTGTITSQKIYPLESISL